MPNSIQIIIYYKVLLPLDIRMELQQLWVQQECIMEVLYLHWVVPQLTPVVQLSGLDLTDNVSAFCFHLIR
jgi:hypothetical protein